jgi:hypothetical protein
MRTVIIRDDDTNALTPVECLEKLYRPFLARGLPVNLAVIPEVQTTTRLANGHLEGYLANWVKATTPPFAPVAENVALTGYLHANPGLHVVQHGCHHDAFEFNRTDRREVIRRLERGARQLRAAGFSAETAFVAPHDKFSPAAFDEVVRRYRVLSTGWFEWRRVPPRWWPRYLVKKLLAQPHWRIGRTRLLSHPGCLLSYTRPFETMLDTIKRAVARQKVTVLVTHWWEYFRHGHADEKFIRVLHDTAEWLAAEPDVRVKSFSTLAAEDVPAQRTLYARLAPPPTFARAD